MGGHGALVCALRNPAQYRSVSAFAPIVAPSQVPWGHKAFGHSLGANRDEWLAYDATHLVQMAPRADTILVDQGLGDKFLAEQLRPELFEAACDRSGQKLLLRRHALAVVYGDVLVPRPGESPATFRERFRVALEVAVARARTIAGGPRDPAR